MAPNLLPVTMLSISWLNNQFAAKAIHRGSVAGAWECTVAPESDPDFGKLVREAVQKTHFHGTSVSLLLANAKLAQQLVEVPPVTGSGLVKVIQREVLQQQFFSGEAAWTFQTSLTVKDVQRVILHLLPNSLLDQYISACRQNELHLGSVVPVSAVLHQQLTLLPLNKGDVALLAAETGGCTTVVVGRADGELLLVRTLLGNWNENPERLALDLKRTMSFITQQYDLSINTGVWIFGQGAEQHAPLLQRQLEQPVAVSPVEWTPDYWALESARLRPGNTPNFIGLEMQQAPQRRKFAFVIAAATALIVLASLAVTVILQRQARQEAANNEILRKRVDQLETQRQELTQRNTELEGKEELITRVSQDHHEPVPTWILGYLSEALPTDLVVTNLQVTWENEAWKLHLAGTLQRSAHPGPSQALPNGVAVLVDRLATGPFHFRIVDRSDKTSSENPFWIEGVTK